MKNYISTPDLQSGPDLQIYLPFIFQQQERILQISNGLSYYLVSFDCLSEHSANISTSYINRDNWSKIM